MEHSREMTRTLVIAECGSSWDCDLSKAFRLIDAAKECGADVAKFQWTSNAFAMAKRRGLGANAAAMYVKYLQYPVDTLRQLKAHCDEVGIEFMVTVYLPEDIKTIDPLVKRFKISAFEADWAFMQAHREYGKEIIASINNPEGGFAGANIRNLWCVSKYPTAIEDLKLSQISVRSGFSCHCPDSRVGGWAVAAGAEIIEAHVRLYGGSHGPDYPHSFEADCHSCNSQGDWGCEGGRQCFRQFVDGIRDAEKAL